MSTVLETASNELTLSTNSAVDNVITISNTLPNGAADVGISLLLLGFGVATAGPIGFIFLPAVVLVTLRYATGSSTSLEKTASPNDMVNNSTEVDFPIAELPDIPSISDISSMAEEFIY